MQTKWTQAIKSNAMDLPKGIFTWTDPVKIASALKRSVEESTRTKGTKFSSAMSMLNLYINRSGKNLHSAQKKILERTKIELRILYKKNT